MPKSCNVCTCMNHLYTYSYMSMRAYECDMYARLHTLNTHVYACMLTYVSVLRMHINVCLICVAAHTCRIRLYICACFSHVNPCVRMYTILLWWNVYVFSGGEGMRQQILMYTYLSIVKLLIMAGTCHKHWLCWTLREMSLPVTTCTFVFTYVIYICILTGDDSFTN